MHTVRQAISIPLTVKIRIQNPDADLKLAMCVEDAGADALIVHGRRWQENYDVPCNLKHIAAIKQQLSIPVIANGDISNNASLYHAFNTSGCDGFMIARGGSGSPWLYQELLQQISMRMDTQERIAWFMTHLSGLSALENEFKAVLQSKSLVRYYFKKYLTPLQLAAFYTLDSLSAIEHFLMHVTNSA